MNFYTNYTLTGSYFTMPVGLNSMFCGTSEAPDPVVYILRVKIEISQRSTCAVIQYQRVR